MKSIFIFACLLSMLSCSSSPKVKQQAYAKLQSSRTFEYDFPTVWKGIEAAFTNYKITDRDPSDVDVNELKNLRERTLKTDWIYAQSRDKYQEYKVNGSPRKQYLQTRLRFEVVAASVMGGVDVKVKPDEEIEKLDKNGKGDGYSSVDHPDTSRAGEVLDKINQAILSLPNT